MKKNGNGKTGAVVKVDDRIMGTSEDVGGELARTTDAAQVLAEIQGAMTLAKRFPRNEEGAYAALLKSCRRPSFAREAMYAYPRANITVSGPSVNLAREFARLWGNIQTGLQIVYDDEEQRKIRAFAWDLQTNTRIVLEDDFPKLIFRKDKRTGEGFWIKPDERDLRELTFRKGAILERNCILKLMPRDFVEDGLLRVRETLANEFSADPDAHLKTVLLSFGELNITPGMLHEYLGHPVAEAQPEQIAELRAIYKSIRDGNSVWAEYKKVEPEPDDDEPETPGGDLSDLATVEEDEDRTEEDENGDPAGDLPEDDREDQASLDLANETDPRGRKAQGTRSRRS